MNPIRWLLLRPLLIREWLLEGQADFAQELIKDHVQRYANTCDELRRVKGKIAMLTPAHKLLADVPPSGVTR